MPATATTSVQTSPFDQTQLTNAASRLVEAARHAGADAADAVAVRSMSLSVEVRDDAVEEAERSESDDVGLRVLVGGRQAIVSTNDTKGDPAALAARAVAMARVAPQDRFAGLADTAALARDLADLDLIDNELPTPARLEALARTAEGAALAVKGVSKSGGASASTGIPRSPNRNATRPAFILHPPVSRVSSACCETGTPSRPAATSAARIT